MMRALLLMVACIAPACGAPVKAEPLEQAIRVYNDGLRWQRYDDAAERLPAARRPGFLDDRDRLGEDLRIVGYEMVRARADADGVRAKVHMKYDWYLDSRGTLHVTHTVQEWQQRGKIWVLVEESHLRGEPMPGVAEGDDEVDAPGADDEAAAEDGRVGRGPGQAPAPTAARAR